MEASAAGQVPTLWNEVHANQEISAVLLLELQAGRMAV
jgi:hypothetical protein